MDEQMQFPPSVFPGAPVRARELAQIVEAIRQNQCCAVVGPSNTGKSLLLKSLLEEEVRRACALEGDAPPVMVFVDLLRPAEGEPAFYELLLRSIATELRRSQAPQPVLEELRGHRNELLRSPTAMAARSWFDEAIYALSEKNDMRLALIMDEFDPAFKALPPAPFQTLRVLRDEVVDRLMLVTGTSHHLHDLRADEGTSEFRELFDLHTCILCPLDEADCRRFVAYLEREQGSTLDEERAAWAIELSGGHPGLLDRVCHLLMDVEADLGATRDDALHALIGTWAIQEECRRLWSEIEPYEQEGLLAVVETRRMALDPARAQALLAKGLVVRPADGPWAVFSPVFGAFVRAQLEARRQDAPHGLSYNSETGQIWVDGKDISRELSAEQYDLLTYLCARPGIVCSKDEIAQAVWPEDYGADIDITDAQIYQLIKRVREKVEPDVHNPRYIVTVRGRGYRFEKQSQDT